MKTVHEIKQEMELIEIVKSALDVNGQVAQKLIKKWTHEDSDSHKGTTGGTVKGHMIFNLHNETVLNKNDLDKLSKSINEILDKNWSEAINKIENPVQIKKEFNLQSIPLQLLTKVNIDTSSREIEQILNTVKSITPSGVTKYDKEGVELTRIERILENRIEENLKANELKSLEINVRLLLKIKEGYKPFRPIGCRA